MKKRELHGEGRSSSQFASTRFGWLFWLLTVGSLYSVPSLSAETQSYASHPKLQVFVAEMEKKHGFDQSALLSLFSQAVKKQSILDAISRPAEKTKPWYEYRKIFVTEKRINQGVAFWQQHAELLGRVEKEYGVPASIIVAILGVETRYGRNTGSYRVIDALSTLAFDYPRRAKFFRKELEHFMLLAREQNKDALSLTGSYAGAMGYGQFMPSSYRAYSVDYDGDGFNDIWHNTSDAVASIANYFKRHGWKTGGRVATPATAASGFDQRLLNVRGKPKYTIAELKNKGFVGSEVFADDQVALALVFDNKSGPAYWLGLSNFYVITRYNHSHLYAMAVYQLSEKIKALYHNR